MEATMVVPVEHDTCSRCGQRPPPGRGYAVRHVKRPYALFCLPCGVALEWMPDENEINFIARYPDGPRG
jgi:hypothetical protein